MHLFKATRSNRVKEEKSVPCCTYWRRARVADLFSQRGSGGAGGTAARWRGTRACGAAWPRKSEGDGQEGGRGGRGAAAPTPVMSRRFGAMNRLEWRGAGGGRRAGGRCGQEAEKRAPPCLAGAVGREAGDSEDEGRLEQLQWRD